MGFFFEIIYRHTDFRCLYFWFRAYFQVNNLDESADEALRSRLRTLKEMIQRLLLVTLMAFQLLLMYVGENAGQNLRTYERFLFEDDKKYLRRNLL